MSLLLEAVLVECLGHLKDLVPTYRIVTKAYVPKHWWQWRVKYVTYVETDFARMGSFSTPQDAEAALRLAGILKYEIVKAIEVIRA